jgi:hypothetical protein
MSWLGYKLGIDHDGVDRSMSEEGLNHVDRSVVVQVFGGEDTPAIIGSRSRGEPSDWRAPAATEMARMRDRIVCKPGGLG